MNRLFHHIITFLACILLIGTLSSCGAPDYSRIAEKINNGKELSSGDRDDMLQYLRNATEAELPQLRQARTYEDVERIDRLSRVEYPYIDLFSSALLRDYNSLSVAQTQEFSDIRQLAQDAFSK